MSKEQLSAPDSQALEWLHRRQNRQRLIRAAAKFALLGTVIGSQAISTVESINYNKEATVQSLTDNPIDNLLDWSTRGPQFEHSATLVVPGFNMSWHDSRQTARVLQPSFSAIGTVGWVGYPDKNRGAGALELREKTLQYIKEHNIEELSLYGVSFGGELGFDLALELQAAGVKIPNIYLDSSPARTSDAYDQAGLVWAASPFMTPVTYSVRKSTDQHGVKPWQIISDVFADLTAYNDETRMSFAVVKAQADYIGTAQIPSNIDKLLSPDTVITYIGSDADTVINTRSAYRHYQELFPSRTIQHYSSSPEGAKPASHASPVGDNDIYAPIFKDIVRSQLPPERPPQSYLPNEPR